MATGYFAYEDLIVSSTALGFTAATRGTANRATISCEVAPVRYVLNGGTPTASSGQTLEVGDKLILDSEDQITRARFIRREGTDSTLRCSFGKEV